MNKTQALRTLLSPDYMIKEVVEVHRLIRRHIREAPDKAFKTYWDPTSRKFLVAVDLLAEQLFINAVTARCGRENVRVDGEESLNENLNLQQETRICVLVDMIDGTDLLQRGFSNWCSAIVVFSPQDKKIEGAFIALPLESMYFATQKDGAFKKRLSPDTKGEAAIPLTITVEKSIRDASVCTYAQKSGILAKLLGELGRRKFIHWLRQNAELASKGKKTGEEVGFRFYNLAGNPMMMRLVDGSVDIVFDIKGQAPHDVVPGAFIAVKAGAVLAQPTGRPLTLTDLSTSLLQPGSPAAQLTYVLGANQNMVAEMTGLLAEEWDGKVDRRTATVDRRQGWARPPQIQMPPPSPGH